MTRLDSSAASSPVDRAIESALEAVDASDRYPSGTSFIAADLPSFDSHFRRVISEGRPIVVVLPDGDELLLKPRQERFPRTLMRAWRAFTAILSMNRPSDAGPLIGDGAPGEPFDVALMRLSVAGYEAHLHGLRR
jgi:hypothetical protein